MTDDNISDNQLRLLNIFLPLAMEKFNAARKNNIRFVHYTTADAAMNILRSKEVWMRKTSCMNDYMEVKQGIDCLVKAYHSKVGEQLQATLNEICSGIADEIANLFDDWIPHFVNDTYIACLSEHKVTEDAHGRLSMWRAYSQSTGVALVLNNAPFLAYVGPSGVYSSPVAYLDDEAFECELQRVVEGIRGNEAFLRGQGRETLVGAVFNAFKCAALCTKHPGFIEEREWRAIYMPLMEKSPRVKICIEAVAGTPQTICKFSLMNSPGDSVSGIELPELLDRIIVGPTKYPEAMFEAFTSLLAGAEVNDPASRVHISGIPLRL